ncbi:MAG: hypothetical protein IJM65_00525 [Bacteroidales bacterium]|nr:hypothetical protein [Bacteroidales bacterium]
MGKHFAVPAFLVSVLFCGCEKYAGEPVTMEFSIAGTYTELQVEAAELDIALSGASILFFHTHFPTDVLGEKGGDSIG